MRSNRTYKYYPLMGGEDLVTPQHSRSPGSLKGSRNFECDAGGRYRRIDGYERFDGHSSPSDASYWKMPFRQGTAIISAGDTVTGEDSSATGIALIDAIIDSGSYVGGDAAGHLIIRELSGAFTYEENLQVSAVTKSVCDGRAIKRGDNTNDTTYYNAAVEDARDDISAVPGSGSILGVWVYDDVTYAFRNNTAGTAAAMYKSSTSGWTEVTMNDYIGFDAGTDTFTVGDVVTGGITSHTATITKVVVTSGAWGDNDAAGYLMITGATGTFQNNEPLTDVAGGAATADGVKQTHTLLPSGTYEFVNYNFTGHAGTTAMYGCDGVNKAFEYDGTTFTPITTGMTTDTPSHIGAHKNHLFLTFSGGSVQHSSIGFPLTWSAVTGASELALGDEVAGLSKVAGGLLAMFTKTKLKILYGASSADWAIKTLSDETGAVEWSIQKLAEPVFYDFLGISSLGAVDAFGDFKKAALSAIIEPYFTSYQQSTFSCSLRIKEKSQYRMFYTNGTGLNLTFSGMKIAGFTKLVYPNPVIRACSGENSMGREVAFFGSDDGMVYQLEKGTSFDGEPIQALIKTSLNTVGAPSHKKRFFKLEIEKDNQLDEGEWSIGTWGDFKWGSQEEERDASYLDETGTGYDYLYYSTSAYLEPFVLQGIILHYSIGGITR